MKKIGIASDHAGYELKELIIGYLDSLGYDVFDFGPSSPESVSYTVHGHELGSAIDEGTVEMGIGICGSGNGINMTLNKHAKVRAALCWQEDIAELARSHNDANVCVMPARFVENTQAMAIVDKFLNTPFEGGRHIDRVNNIPL